MYPTQLHSYLLWRSSVDPDAQSLASKRHTATVSLGPATMVGVFVFGWWAGLTVFLSVLSAFVTDFILHRWVYKDSTGTRDGMWILTGLLMALMMPPNIPVIWPLLGSAAALFLGKYYFSVDGMPLFQPAALGLFLLHILGGLMLLFAGSNPMLAIRDGKPEWPVLARGIEPSAEISSTPQGVRRLVIDFLGGDIRKSVPRKEYRDKLFSQSARPDDANPQAGAEPPAAAVHGPRPLNLVKDFAKQPLNKGVTAEGTEQRYDWVDMILGYIPGTVGSSGLALGFGILLLIFTGAANWTLPAIMMMTMFAMLHFFSWLGNGSIVAENIPIHLLTGSTILGIFYLAADPTTAPRSFMGKVYAGVLLGFIEVLLRLFTPLTEGIFLSVLIVQALAIVFDLYLAPPTEPQRSTATPLSASSLRRL